MCVSGERGAFFESAFSWSIYEGVYTGTNRSYTEIASWVDTREWHASYTGHRRPRLLACGDRDCRVHPQLLL